MVIGRFRFQGIGFRVWGFGLRVSLSPPLWSGVFFGVNRQDLGGDTMGVGGGGTIGAPWQPPPNPAC